MDCPQPHAPKHGSADRFVRALVCFVLVLIPGCVHDQELAVVTGNPLPPGPPAKPKKEPPKRMPRADTCAALGDYRAELAVSPGQTPASRDMLRDQARRSYRQAIKLDPNCREAYLGLAKLYQDTGKLDRALATYEEGLKALSQDAGLWEKLHGFFDDPRARCKDGSLWFEMGMCQARKKDWEASLVSLRKAVELEPENWTFAKALGFTLARAGYFDDSFVCFEKFLGEAKAHYNLARVLHHVQKHEESKSHLMRALQAQPDFPEAQQFLAELTTPATGANTVVQVSFEEDADLAIQSQLLRD